MARRREHLWRLRAPVDRSTRQSDRAALKMPTRHINLLLLLSTALALEPTTLSDADAAKEYDYIRRKPACSKRGSESYATKTPKLLHQIWWQGEAAIPEVHAPYRATWPTTHPEWKVKLWDEPAIVSLINTSFAWFAPTFHALPSKIQKVDAARYAILHAEGGVYADLDVEAFKPLDKLLMPTGAASTAHLFEEPVTHWTIHDNVISNGLMASPPEHPLMLAILRSIRPVAAVFASTGSHLVQSALQQCHLEENDEWKKKHPNGVPPCGCYVSHSSGDFFPIHEAMRQPQEFKSVREHVEAAHNFVEDLRHGDWPPESAYTAQHWTGACPHARAPRICSAPC